MRCEVEYPAIRWAGAGAGRASEARGVPRASGARPDGAEDSTTNDVATHWYSLKYTRYRLTDFRL